MLSVGPLQVSSLAEFEEVADLSHSARLFGYHDGNGELFRLRTPFHNVPAIDIGI